MKENLINIHWMDFSGSPIIFLPNNLKNVWKGFYSEENINSEDEPDIIIEGKAHYVNDEFDFDNPKTDYDKICGIDKNHFTYKIGTSEIFVINAFYDVFGWDNHRKILINGRIDEFNDVTFSKVIWKDKVEYEITNEKNIIINACEYPLDENIDEDAMQIINLPKGKYYIEQGEYQEKNIAIIYRFT